MASISLPIALLAGGALSAAGGVTSAALGSNAAQTAAGEQVAEQEKALQFQEQVWSQQQANQAPFIGAGQQSIASLMAALGNGTFGPGSLGPVPTAPGAFVPPTLEQAQATPGYEFTQQQGEKGILEGSAAAGGAISGGTLKSLDTFNTNLANNTYGQIYNQALQGYSANLAQYGSQLAGYQTAQGAQQQAFQQLATPAAIGEGATVNLSNAGSSASSTIAQLMQAIGASQAAGTVGSTNAITGGIGNATGQVGQDLLLSQILPLLTGTGAGGVQGVPAGVQPAGIPAGQIPMPLPPTLPPAPAYPGGGAG